MQNKVKKGCADSAEDMSVEGKIKRIEAVVVRWPLFTQIVSKITECHKRSKLTTEPRCLLITGSAGYGKTTIGTYYSGQYQREVADDGTNVPVLYSSIPSSATVKGLASRLLEDLGDPLYDKGTSQNLTSRLCRLIKGCKVELIILDEFQHLINGDSDKVLKSTADWLKDILNRTKVPIVLMGMPSALRILTANAQLMRRFATKFELKAFSWTPMEERDNFLKFLMMLEQATDMPKPSKLYSEDMAFRVFCATKGIVSNLKKLISKAAEITYKKGLECITMEVLALAYDEELALSDPTIQNPFLSAYESLKAPVPLQHSQGSTDAVSKRGRSMGRHKDPITVSDILHR